MMVEGDGILNSSGKPVLGVSARRYWAQTLLSALKCLFSILAMGLPALSWLNARTKAPPGKCKTTFCLAISVGLDEGGLGNQIASTAAGLTDSEAARRPVKKPAGGGSTLACLSCASSGAV